MINLINKLKKIIKLIIFVFIIVNCFKYVFLKEEIVQTSAEENILVGYKEFNYGDYSKVRLLHIDTGEVETMPLDIYLYGVVASEMPASFEEEALKAQAVVARTFTIHKIIEESKHTDMRGRYL